jgi:hypothetical protein
MLLFHLSKNFDTKFGGNGFELWWSSLTRENICMCEKHNYRSFRKRCPNSFWWPLFKYHRYSTNFVQMALTALKCFTNTAALHIHCAHWKVSCSDSFQRWKVLPTLLTCKIAVNISCREIHRSRRVFGVRRALNGWESSIENLFFYK